MKKIIVFSLVTLFLILGGLFIFLKEGNYLVVPQAEKETLKAEVSETLTPKQDQKTSNQDVVLPKTFKLDVSFTSQEPRVFIPGNYTGNNKLWNDDHNNACEEAAIIMVDSYIKGKKLTPEIADKEILAMLNFQEKNYRERNKDLEAKEIAQLAKDYYKDYKNTKVVYDISIEDIKREIFSGHPVILPTAGRMLFGPLSLGMNPNYRSPGPLYHMLVAIGWNDNEREIITNDSGTRKGESFTFGYDVLLNALHEWNGGDIKNGKSVMIILLP